MLADFQKAFVVNQKIQLTVWDPQDDKLELHYRSYIMEFNPPLVKVAHPPSEQFPEIDKRIQAGIVVGAILEAYPTPFVFYPVVHEKQEKAPLGYWLKIPDNPQVETVQQRRHVRIPMMIPVEVEYSIGPKTFLVKGFTEDMSGGGLLFTSARQFYKEQEITLFIKFDEETEELRLKSKVVFAGENRVRRRPDDIYSTACQFIDIDAKQEMLIMRECFRRELKKPV